MLTTIKTYIIWILLIGFIIVLPFTVYMKRSYFTLSAQLETMIKQQDILSKIGVANQEAFASKLYDLDRLFLNNRYILNNQDEH